MVRDTRKKNDARGGGSCSARIPAKSDQIDTTTYPRPGGDQYVDNIQLTSIVVGDQRHIP
jgi:hypothetical protein